MSEPSRSNSPTRNEEPTHESTNENRDHPPQTNRVYSNIISSDVEVLKKEIDRLRRELNDNSKYSYNLLGDFKQSVAKVNKQSEKELKYKEIIDKLKTSLRESLIEKNRYEEENKALRDRLIALELQMGRVEKVAQFHRDDWIQIKKRMEEYQANHQSQYNRFNAKIKEMDEHVEEFCNNSIKLNKVIDAKYVDYGLGCISLEAFTKEKMDEIKKTLEQLKRSLDTEVMQTYLKAVDGINKESKETLELNRKCMERYLELTAKNESLEKKIDEKQSLFKEFLKQCTDLTPAVAGLFILLGILLSFFILFAFNTILKLH